MRGIESPEHRVLAEEVAAQLTGDQLGQALARPLHDLLARLEDLFLALPNEIVDDLPKTRRRLIDQAVHRGHELECLDPVFLGEGKRLVDIAFVEEDGEEQVEHADVEVVLEAQRRRFHHHFLRFDHLLVRAVVPNIARHDAESRLELEQLTLVRVVQRGAVQQHELVRGYARHPGVQQVADALHEALLGLTRQPEDHLAVGLHPLRDHLLLDLCIGVELDVRALDVLEDDGIHRLDGRGHGERAADLPHHLDDPLAAVLPGCGANVAGPVVLVLKPRDEVGDLDVQLVHAEVVVRQAERHRAIDMLRRVDEIGLHVLERVRVHLAVGLHRRVAELAGERAAAGDLHEREVARLPVRIHEPRQVGRGNLVEVQDAVHRTAGDELLRARVDPEVARHGFLLESLETHAGVGEALHEIQEGAFAFIGRPAYRDVDLRHGAEETFLLGDGERKIGAAHQGEGRGILALGIPREAEREVVVPRVAREANDVRLDRLECCPEFLRLAKNRDVGPLVCLEVFRDVRREVRDAQWKHIRADGDLVVSEVGEEDAHGSGI